jgi:DNA mismatch repair protein MutL
MGVPQVSAAGCAQGTIIKVVDLFYNTPARLKFLKRPQTELAHIEETLQALALSRPEVAFTLKLLDKGQDTVALKTTGSGQLGQTLQEVFKLNQSDDTELIPVNLTDDERGVAIQGLTTSPSTQKSSRKGLFLFVNGRVVRCPVFNKAVDAAYESLLPAGRYPLCVVRLTLPCSAVDVNVHPTKKEVRYQYPNEVFSFVRQGIRRGLEAYGIQSYGMGVPAATAVSYQPMAFGLPAHSQHPNQGSWSHSVGAGKPYGSHPSGGLPAVARQQALDFYQPLATPNNPQGEAHSLTEAASTPSRYSVIGQLFNTYILLETPQGLMVVDQHIASERAFFEALSRQILDPVTQGQAVTQPLLISVGHGP